MTQTAMWVETVGLIIGIIGMLFLFYGEHLEDKEIKEKGEAEEKGKHYKMKVLGVSLVLACFVFRVIVDYLPKPQL